MATTEGLSVRVATRKQLDVNVNARLLIPMRWKEML